MAQNEDTGSMKDITAPDVVEVEIRSDGKVVWINVDGKCALRACRIKRLVINDGRPNA